MSGDALIFDEPLRHAHAAGEIVSAEFVRYRWYPDVQFGTAYFHDHVDALHSWRHGLFGALIAEPPGSTYHHPHTGAELRSGPIADIRTHRRRLGRRHRQLPRAGDVHPGRQPAHQGRRLQRRRRSICASSRSQRARSATRRACSAAACTAIRRRRLLEAYRRRPVVMRDPGGGHQRRAHVARRRPLVPGRAVQPDLAAGRTPSTWASRSGTTSVIPRAGGPQAHARRLPVLQRPLVQAAGGELGDPARPTTARRRRSCSGCPGRDPPGAAGARSSGAGCVPRRGREKDFSVAAVEAPLPMLGGATGKIYVLQSDVAALRVGDGASPSRWCCASTWATASCSTWRTRRRGRCRSTRTCWPTTRPPPARGRPQPRPGGGAGRAADLHLLRPSRGRRDGRAACATGATSVENPGRGLYGAIVVGPAGATYTDPVTGDDARRRSTWRVDVHPPDGPAYPRLRPLPAGRGRYHRYGRDAVHRAGAGGGRPELPGRAVPARWRADGVRRLRGGRRRPRERCAPPEDPATPVLEAFAGDPVRVHVLAPFSEQAHVFSVEGHEWPIEPGRPAPTVRARFRSGPLEAITLTSTRRRGPVGLCRATTSTATTGSRTARPACGACSGSTPRARPAPPCGPSPPAEGAGRASAAPTVPAARRALLPRPPQVPPAWPPPPPRATVLGTMWSGSCRRSVVFLALVVGLLGPVPEAGAASQLTVTPGSAAPGATIPS